MSGAVSPRESLVEILRLERVRDGEFVARLEDFWGASLGGDALARAALAAAALCEGLELHSLHASFLRPAAAGTPARAARRAARGRCATAPAARCASRATACSVRWWRASRRPAQDPPTRTPRPLPRFPRPKTCPARSSRRRPRAGATTRAARSSSGARTRASGRIRRGRRRAGTSSGCARARRCPTIRACRWPRSSSWPISTRTGPSSGASDATSRMAAFRTLDHALWVHRSFAGTTGGCSSRPARWRTPAARSRGAASSRATDVLDRARPRRQRSSRRA